MKQLNFILAVLCLAGCLATSAVSCSMLHDDVLVASVGGRKLYKSEVVKFIPRGLSVEDSLSLASQYINAWAGELIMNDMADKQLSEQEKDVSAELEDYRSSLLKYRYEQHYIESRLDTVVTMEQIEEHYQMNKSVYALTVPVVKARYLKIAAGSPVRDELVKLLSSDDEADLQLLDSLAYKNADKLMLFNDKWTDMVVLAREFGTDYGTLIGAKKGSWIDIIDEQSMEHIAYVESYVTVGKEPPLEYCRDRIREAILNQRRYTLSTTLEQQLLDNALTDGTFVIYNTENEKE